MECPFCRSQAPIGAKFCVECGNKFEVPCPACGFGNSPSHKFCAECGQKLAQVRDTPIRDISFDDQLNKIRRYLPQGLIEKILSQRDKIEGERKEVTVMFCDLVGFTPLVEKLGAEEAYAVMDQVYELLIQKVHEYEGTVNELTGDGIMALFGAPVALEDAPQRAVRTAMAINREMARFSDKLRTKRKDIPPLRMRIGMHSGPVVVGTLGNDLRVEFKAVGDTVNLASRMEGLAEPGTTYVTEEVFKLTEGFFRFEALGSRQVKGKKDPVRVYRVIAPSGRRTRFDVSAEQGLTRFVGRERELELLLDSLARARGGSGQVFSIIGEAGIGKSRFLYEFCKAVSNEDITFVEGKCLSFARGIPFHPISDLLKGVFFIGADDSDQVVRDKVRRGLEAMQADETATLPYLLELLGVKEPGINRLSMSPEGLKDRLVEAVKHIIVKGARLRPLVIAMEDLHWADKSSEDALKWLLKVVPATRVLIILTYRPEFLPAWGGHSYHNQITLNRLSNRESLLMVSHILGTEAVDPALQRLILDKTEGVPFFIEEFVRSLQDLGLIKREDDRVVLQQTPQTPALPSRVQDMIMARVDRLPDGAKGVLQAGSVIEREFPHRLIQMVTSLPEPELLSHLSALKDAELLYERGVYPQTSYIFRHALTREVVCDSILTRRRKELHGRIGAAIEDLHQDDIFEYVEILSEHFFQSEDYAKAADYARRAARKAEKRASLPDAIAHARRRVLCLDKFSDQGTDNRERVEAHTIVGLHLNQLNRWIEAKEAVEPVVGLARNLDHRKPLGQIQNIMGAYYGYIDEDLPKAITALNEALAIAGRENDFVTLVMASIWLGNFHSYNCEFDKAEASFQRAIDITTAGGIPWGIVTTKALLGAFCYYYMGKISLLEEITREVLDYTGESGDTISKGGSHTAYGAACFAKGNLNDAEMHIREGKNHSERVGMLGWSTTACWILAETYFEKNEFLESKQCYEQGLQEITTNQALPSLQGLFQLGMAKCEAALGRQPVQLEPLRRVYETNRTRILQGCIPRYLGETLVILGGGHMAEAGQWIGKAVEADDRNGMRFSLARDHALYGEFYKKQGDLIKAKEEIEKAIEVFQECQADGWVNKYKKELTSFV